MHKSKIESIYCYISGFCFKLIILILLVPFIVFLFSITKIKAQNQDVIGVRVYENAGDMTDYPASYTNGIYPPVKWYNNNVPNPGQPQSTVIAGYPAIQDGRTIYIGAINKDHGLMGSYIYLISVNDGASEDTMEIMRQVLQNIDFNSHMESAQDKVKLKRDFDRILKINSIRQLLKEYKQKNGHYPILAQGTYLPFQTYSVWPSWDSALGRELGQTLPKDPINKFYGCEMEDDVSDLTCWNQKEGRFYCPEKAYVFSYQSLDQGDSYRLLANYEYKDNFESWQSEKNVINECISYQVVGDTADADHDGISDAFDTCVNDARPNKDCSDQNKYKFVSKEEVLKDKKCKLMRLRPDLCYIQSSDGFCDLDVDGIGDICDSCPDDPNNDIDADFVCAGAMYQNEMKGAFDNCPKVYNPLKYISDDYIQPDSDEDGFGDACDRDTCGNNTIEGFEECDWGEENSSHPCYASYNSECEYCDLNCNLTKVSGGRCGDGEIQKEYEKCEKLAIGQLLHSDGSKRLGLPSDSKNSQNQYDCRDCSWAGGWCGDLIVQKLYNEDCEPKLEIENPGVSKNMQYECNADCKWDGGWCGDNIIQKEFNEICDDGALNGQPGHCSVNCTTREKMWNKNNWNEDNVLRNTAYIENGNLQLPLKNLTSYLWGSNSADNRVFRVPLPNPNPDSITYYDIEGENPSRIAVDLNGDLWVVMKDSGNINKLDKKSGRVLKNCQVGRDPGAISIDANGYVWVSNYNDGTVMKFSGDDDNCTILEGPIIIPGAKPFASAIDGFGTLWISNRNETNNVSIIKVNILDSPPTWEEIDLGAAKNPDGSHKYGYPYGIAVDRNNNIWLAIYSGAKILKLNPNIGSIAAEIDLAKYYYNLDIGRNSDNTGKPRILALDSNNYIWASHRDMNPGRVSVINSDAQVVDTHIVGDKPMAMSCDSWENMWIINNHGKGPNIIRAHQNRLGSTVTKIPLKYSDDKITYKISSSNDSSAHGDLSGYALRSVALRNASWIVLFNSQDDNVDWKYLYWGREYPLAKGTFVKIRVRTADTKEGLKEAQWQGGDFGYFEESPVYLDNFNGLDNKKWIQIEMKLHSFYDDITPEVSNVRIKYE
jgi:sugar lactone lactonase YvrE